MHERTRYVIPIVGARWDESDELGFQRTIASLIPENTKFTQFSTFAEMRTTITYSYVFRETEISGLDPFRERRFC